MEPSIYSFSLCTALPLMLFFGFYFLFAKTPEKKIFTNYLRSRQIMGIAMLLLSANYSVHFFFGIRFKNADSAILMNMSTYFLCYSLFSSALIMLLDRFYITKRRVWTHIILWIIFSTLSGVVLFLLPSGIMQKFSLFALAAWLVVFGVVLARRVNVRLPNGKNQIGNNLCSKKHRKRSQKPISKKCSNNKKVLIRQFKVLIRQKDAQTTIFIKFYSKSFSNLLGIE